MKNHFIDFPIRIAKCNASNALEHMISSNFPSNAQFTCCLARAYYGKIYSLFVCIWKIRNFSLMYFVSVSVCEFVFSKRLKIYAAKSNIAPVEMNGKTSHVNFPALRGKSKKKIQCSFEFRSHSSVVSSFIFLMKTVWPLIADDTHTYGQTHKGSL